MTGSKAERFARFCELREEFPDDTAAELAVRMQASLRTIERFEAERRKILSGKATPRINSFHERAYFFLVWLCSRRTAAPAAAVRQFFREELGTEERTMERCLKDLRKQGLIRAEGGYCAPGERLLPRLNLTPEECETLAKHFETSARRGPLNTELQSVLVKLRLGISGEIGNRILQRAAKRQQRILVKGAPRSKDRTVVYRVDQLLALAEVGCTLELEYHSPEFAETLRPVVQPWGVVYNWLNDHWYLAANVPEAGLQYYRLDRLSAFRGTGRFTPPPRDPFPEELRLAWGMENGRPVRVRVRFRNDFNVSDKVRHDLAGRSSTVLTQLPDGGLILTDTVAGLNDFRRWLRQFGASAEALEPEELRKSLLEGAKRKLARYANGGEGQ